MKKKLLDYLACPTCGGIFQLEEISHEKGEIKEGSLDCSSCHRTFLIRNFIPRFSDGKTYVDAFSLEWNIHRTTQLDSAQNFTDSRDTLKLKTGFDLYDFKSKLVLEAGCGMGRFMEIVSDFNGEIIGVDLSLAVDAAFENVGLRNNVHIIQGDIFHLPLKKEIFDYIYSLGVLMATPNTKKAFLSLVPHLKKQGKVGIWVYGNAPHKLQDFVAKFWRIFTTRIPKKLFYRMNVLFVPPLYHLHRLPLIGKYLWHIFPVCNEVGKTMDWRILSTFDWYAPKYLWKHTNEELKSWFEEAGLHDMETLEFPVSMQGKK